MKKLIGKYFMGKDSLKPEQPGEATMGTVISDYETAYPDPLVATAGEELLIGVKASEWNGWVWCTRADGRSGWVPDTYVRREGNKGVLLFDYDATELSVKADEKLALGKKESGWIWCTNSRGESGWVPEEHVRKIK